MGVNEAEIGDACHFQKDFCRKSEDFSFINLELRYILNGVV